MSWTETQDVFATRLSEAPAWRLVTIVVGILSNLSIVDRGVTELI